MRNDDLELVPPTETLADLREASASAARKADERVWLE